MSNVLPNGTVLPYGIMGLQGREASIAAFNQSYRNTGLKAGFIVATYAANDPSNKSQLCTEYDVQTIEQFENKGSTSILYKNCLSSQGFGSIADYLEFTLRSQTYNTNKGLATFSSQDGAVVLIKCLDNCGDKAVVEGYLIHPDRPTNITSTAPQLAGEYNGVNVKVANDGSCSLTFKGATDSKGAPTDPSQGNTEFQIKADGSFQFSHSAVTISADKSGVLTITAKGDANVTVGGNVNATVAGNTNLTTTGKTIITSKEIDLNVKSPESGNGILTSNGTYSVVDFITGVPVLPSNTTFGDV